MAYQPREYNDDPTVYIDTFGQRFPVNNQLETNMAVRPGDTRSKAVAIVSGGLDSTVLAYSLRHYQLTMVSFNYGQKHVRELGFAARTAEKLNADHIVFDLSQLGMFLESSLTDPAIDVPHGHYAAENMKSTVVPNRNAIMLSIAYGVAVSRRAVLCAFGVHAGDHFVYPDCRPEFVRAINQAFLVGNEGFNEFAEPRRESHIPASVTRLEVVAPFVHMTKADIVGIGANIGVPFEDTWSCYEGEPRHCGECGTCVERKEAFELAKVKDPTVYRPASPITSVFGTTVRR